MMYEEVFKFEHDDDAPYPDYFCLYRVYGKTLWTIGIGTGQMTEEMCVSTLSHEAIELLLTLYEEEDSLPYNIHRIIGVYSHPNHFTDIKRELTDEDYINNVDGLPNLPKYLNTKECMI